MPAYIVQIPLKDNYSTVLVVAAESQQHAFALFLSYLIDQEYKIDEKTEILFADDNEIEAEEYVQEYRRFEDITEQEIFCNIKWSEFQGIATEQPARRQPRHKKEKKPKLAKSLPSVESQDYVAQVRKNWQQQDAELIRLCLQARVWDENDKFEFSKEQIKKYQKGKTPKEDNTIWDELYHHIATYHPFGITAYKNREQNNNLFILTRDSCDICCDSIYVAVQAILKRYNFSDEGIQSYQDAYQSVKTEIEQSPYDQTYETYKAALLAVALQFHKESVNLVAFLKNSKSSLAKISRAMLSDVAREIKYEEQITRPEYLQRDIAVVDFLNEGDSAQLIVYRRKLHPIVKRPGHLYKQLVEKKSFTLGAVVPSPTSHNDQGELGNYMQVHVSRLEVIEQEEQIFCECKGGIIFSRYGSLAPRAFYSNKNGGKNKAKRKLATYYNILTALAQDVVSVDQALDEANQESIQLVHIDDRLYTGFGLGNFEKKQSKHFYDTRAAMYAALNVNFIRHGRRYSIDYLSCNYPVNVGRYLVATRQYGINCMVIINLLIKMQVVFGKKITVARNSVRLPDVTNHLAAYQRVLMELQEHSKEYLAISDKLSQFEKVAVGATKSYYEESLKKQKKKIDKLEKKTHYLALYLTNSIKSQFENKHKKLPGLSDQLSEMERNKVIAIYCFHLILQLTPHIYRIGNITFRNTLCQRIRWFSPRINGMMQILLVILCNSIGYFTSFGCLSNLDRAQYIMMLLPQLVNKLMSGGEVCDIKSFAQVCAHLADKVNEFYAGDSGHLLAMHTTGGGPTKCQVPPVDQCEVQKDIACLSKSLASDKRAQRKDLSVGKETLRYMAEVVEKRKDQIVEQSQQRPDINCAASHHGQSSSAPRQYSNNKAFKKKDGLKLFNYLFPGNRTYFFSRKLLPSAEQFPPALSNFKITGRKISDAQLDLIVSLHKLRKTRLVFWTSHTSIKLRSDLLAEYNPKARYRLMQDYMKEERNQRRDLGVIISALAPAA